MINQSIKNNQTFQDNLFTSLIITCHILFFSYNFSFNLFLTEIMRQIVKARECNTKRIEVEINVVKSVRCLGVSKYLRRRNVLVSRQCAAHKVAKSQIQI